MHLADAFLPVSACRPDPLRAIRSVAPMSHAIARDCAMPFRKVQTVAVPNVTAALQLNCNDGMLRSKVFQMRVQYPKKDIFVVSRLRNFENPLVVRFVGESDAQAQLFGDEIDCV